MRPTISFQEQTKDTETTTAYVQCYYLPPELLLVQTDPKLPVWHVPPNLRPMPELGDDANFRMAAWIRKLADVKIEIAVRMLGTPFNRLLLRRIVSGRRCSGKTRTSVLSEFSIFQLNSTTTTYGEHF
jgi:hypothetical protein